MNSKKIAFLGLFLAAALVLSYIESLIPFFFGVPGMKLGLSNAMVMVLLYLYGVRECVLVNTLRIIITGMLFGNVFSVIYSLGGAFLALLVMLLLKKSEKFELFAVSACGGMAHNTGQLIVASLVFKSQYLWYYLPALLLSGLICGGLTGFISAGVIPRIKGLLK